MSERAIQHPSVGDRPLVAGQRWSSLAGRIDPHALLLTLLSVLALGPMLQPGYFWGAHDARHSVYFLFEFDRVFQDGVWYPRWFPDMTYGYGYPLFNIYGPLAFYAGELFHLLGADLVTSVKLVFALAWVLSGLAMYGFVRRVFGSSDAAFISGLAYVFMPYHLIDVYVRAALAESVALLFLPLTLWAFYETIVLSNKTSRARILRENVPVPRDVSAPRLRAILFAAFAYAGMLFAHNGIALLFSPVLGAWILFLLWREKRNTGLFQKAGFLEFVRRGLPALGALVLGLGLTGIFLLPLVAEYKFVNVAQWTANYYNYAEHFVELFQLFSPTWGFGISTPGPQDGLSFQFGAMPFILAAFAIAAAVRNSRGQRPLILFFLVLTGLVTFLMFGFSLPVWQAFGLASVAQFPWRLLTLTTLSLSVLAGTVLLGEAPAQKQSADGSTFRLPVLALGALILLGSYPYITAQNLLEAVEGPVNLAGLMKFESSANEMTGSTIYAQEQPTWSPLADLMVAGKNVKSKVDYGSKPETIFIGQTKDGFHTNSERIGFNAQEDNTPITFNVQHYPGWRVYLLKPRTDEIIRELPIEIEPPYGRIKVLVPKGEYWLLLRFEDTPPRVLGQIMSGVSLLAAAGLFSWESWRRRHARLKVAEERSPVS